MSYTGYALIISRSHPPHPITTLSITLGRIPNDPSIQQNQSFYGVSSEKNISRAHCTIQYSDITSSWFIGCNGKNGIILNTTMKTPSDGLQPLQNKDRIQIGDNAVYFVCE